jgi:hypothetical protein
MADVDDRMVHPLAVHGRIPRPPTDPDGLGQRERRGPDRDDAPHGMLLCQAASSSGLVGAIRACSSATRRR